MMWSSWGGPPTWERARTSLQLADNFPAAQGGRPEAKTRQKLSTPMSNPIPGIQVPKGWCIPKPSKDQDSGVMTWTKDNLRGHCFLGFAGYYLWFIFIRYFASIAKPLYCLTENGAAFRWTDQWQFASKELCHLLTTTPMLAYHDSDTLHFRHRRERRWNQGHAVARGKWQVRKCSCIQQSLSEQAQKAIFVEIYNKSISLSHALIIVSYLQ